MGFGCGGAGLREVWCVEESGQGKASGVQVILHERVREFLPSSSFT